MKNKNTNFLLSKTIIKKFQFKKFSQVFISSILFSSFKNKNKIFFTQFLNVFFLDYGKNLLYTESAGEIDFDFPPQIINTTFFLSEITPYEKKILKIFHVKNFISFLKKFDYAVIKKGKDREKKVKIIKIENDFAFFINLNDDLTPKKNLFSKKTKQIFFEKEGNHENFLNKIKIKYLDYFPKNKIAKKTEKNFEKISQRESDLIFIKNSEKIFYDSRNFSTKVLIGQELNSLKFLNLDETIEFIDIAIVQKTLITLKTDLIKGKDFFNNIIFCGSFVKIISGIYKKVEGVIKFIKENLLILKCRSLKKNNGFIIISSEKVSLIEENPFKENFPSTFLNEKINQNQEKNSRFQEIQNFKKSSEKIDFEITNKGKLVNISKKNLTLKKFI